MGQALGEPAGAELGAGDLHRATAAIDDAARRVSRYLLSQLAVNTVAGTLAQTGTTFSSDNDPDLIRESIPFALKLYESILESTPKHKELLIATCSAFTQYAYGFIEGDAEEAKPGFVRVRIARSSHGGRFYAPPSDPSIIN